MNTANCDETLSFRSTANRYGSAAALRIDETSFSLSRFLTMIAYPISSFKPLITDTHWIPLKLYNILVPIDADKVVVPFRLFLRVSFDVKFHDWRAFSETVVTAVDNSPLNSNFVSVSDTDVTLTTTKSGGRSFPAYSVVKASTMLSRTTWTSLSLNCRPFRVSNTEEPRWPGCYAVQLSLMWYAVILSDISRLIVHPKSPNPSSGAVCTFLQLFCSFPSTCFEYRMRMAR